MFRKHVCQCTVYVKQLSLFLRKVISIIFNSIHHIPHIHNIPIRVCLYKGLNCAIDIISIVFDQLVDHQ